VICPTCNHTTSHLKILPDGRECCSNCGGFSETGGVKTDKILTRQSDRVRQEQQQHEGDMLPPYLFNKATGNVEVNHDFVELYPNQAAQTFSKDELVKAGHSHLLERAPASESEDIEFNGNAEEAIKEIVK
jgi:hypothetical protein